MVYEEVNDKGKNIHLKLPVAIIDRIDERVQKREFESRPDFVKTAVRWYLDYLEGRDSGRIREFIVPDVPPGTPRSSQNNKGF